MKELFDLQLAIRNFEDGDLLAIADICETAADLQKSVEDDHTNGLLNRISSLSEELIMKGSDQGLIDELKGIGDALIRQDDIHNKKEVKIPDSDPQESIDRRTLNEVRIEDMDILSSFIIEAHDHLDDIEERILDLERNFNEQTVNDIFRSMHTIKGVSSFIGLERIKELSHQLETILNNLRCSLLEMDDRLIDILLWGGDTLQKMVMDIERQAEMHKDEDSPFTIYEGIIDTREIESRMSTYTDVLSDVPSDISKSEQPEQDIISEEMVGKFVEETSELLDVCESSLLSLEKDPSNIKRVEEAFRAIHTVKGNAGFFGYGYLEQLCMGIENILDKLRSNGKVPEEKVITLLLRSIDNLNATLEKISNGQIDPESQDPNGGISYAEDEGEVPGGFHLIGDMLVEMGIVSREAVDEALDMQNMRLGEILVRQGAALEDEVEQALQQQGKVAAPSHDHFESYRMKRRDIRVDTERIDKLFDLMGEIITAEAMVINNPDVQDLDLPNFERSSDYLMKITREMQEITMAIRMIPLDGLFSKMRRLVRDLSKKFDKPIDFIISGEGTEMDRTVMEEISDPLLHIIRNAVDHGIEEPAVREHRGKDEKGTIHLDAKYEGNEIWITVSDDGGGLNRRRILERSVERGLIQGDPQELKDDEVWKLIFEPGFSTAEKVSEISGRGVGMDVVKRNIEKLRGKIDIHSTEGQGSTFIMKIPLTLAIIDAITFNVGKQLYSIPMTDVLKFHKASGGELTKTDTNCTVLSLHNELIPLVKLYDFYNITSEKKEVVDGILIIIQARDKKLAILVDDIIGYRQIVIKSLPPHMKNIRALAGCSVMADGQVSFILDTGAFISYNLE